MIIDCISDLHGFLPHLRGGDLLIIAGDLTGRDTHAEYIHFLSWLHKQNYQHYIFIAGNHDGLIEKGEAMTSNLNRTSYLCDSGCEFEGLKIWGSPWTPTFYDWHFMKDRGGPIKEKWDLIPDDTDILITHGPPFGILDKVKYSSKGNKDKFAGCEELRIALDRVKPRLHVFGHVHEGYGQTKIISTPRDVLCVNASIMDENYEPVNKPIRVIL